MRLVIAATLLACVVAHPVEEVGKLTTDCGRFIHSKFFFGNRTDIDDFTWLVLLEYDTPRGLRDSCGGVLITSSHVLTAAHCVANIPANWTLKSVRLGEYDTSTQLDCFDEGDIENTTICLPEATSVPVEAIFFHENFGQYGRDNDLAVVRLAEAVNATPICLPSKTAQPQKFHAAGWGRLAGRFGSGPKLRSFVSLFNDTLCKDGYATQNVLLADDQFCAGGRHSEWACFGDSGGPLMGVEKMADGSYKMAVFGVLTTDSRFCDVEGWPAVYTKVLDHLDWIREQIE